MRHQVPFVGERKVVRAEDEQARAKRLSGKVIDDVVGEGTVPSSWEDVVPEGWVDCSVPKVIKPAVSEPLALAITKAPIRPAAASKPSSSKPLQSLHETVTSSAKKNTTSTAAITFSDSASLDWTPINNGRGLRVNIHGCIDNELRKEWTRLLEGTADTGVEEFEFNLSDTPALSLTGLGMLLLFKERKRSGRDAISLCNCNKEVAQLLEWTGMDRYFVIKTMPLTEPS